MIARVPVRRPRKYKLPTVVRGKHVTTAMLREIADSGPDELRDETLKIVEKFESQGWIELDDMIYVSEAKILELEREAKKQVEEHQAKPLPGFRAEWERTVGVYEFNDGSITLQPVVTMWALKRVASDEEAADRFLAVAQEHDTTWKVGRIN